MKDESQQPPSTSREPETGNVRLKNDARERLRKNICSVDDPRSVFNNERIRRDVRTDEVVANINVFGLSMIGVVDRERPGTIVVGREDERRWATNLELSKGLTKPDTFLNSTRESNVLGFSG